MADRHTVSRRKFLKKTVQAATAAVAFPYIIPASARGADGHVAPSNRVVMASIGVGGQGSYDMSALLHHPDVQMVGVCDVDTSHREQAKGTIEEYYTRKFGAGGYTGCKTYNDFRHVLERDDIDAVLVATPDHWHAVITAAAARSGKDIYCEKPLAGSIPDGRHRCTIPMVNQYNTP